MYFLRNEPKDPKTLTKRKIGEHNFGFDTQDGEYICEIGDHIYYRFEIV